MKILLFFSELTVPVIVAINKMDKPRVNVVCRNLGCVRLVNPDFPIKRTLSTTLVIIKISILLFRYFCVVYRAIFAFDLVLDVHQHH